MSASVLYDAPGPDERRRERRISLVLTAVLAVGIGLLGYQLFRNGVFDDRWMVLFEVPPNFAGFEARHVWQAILSGLGATLLAAVIALPIALVLAVLLVSLRSSPFKPLVWLVSALIEVFRGLPVVLVMLFAILVVPGATPLFAVVFGLVVYNSAVFAEIIRAGITSLPRGQSEAAAAIGLRPFQIYRMILLPQSIRTMLPSLIAQGVVLVKDSSLGYIVSYAELLRQINLVADALLDPRYLLPMLSVGAALFIGLNISLSRLAVRVERSGDRRRAAAERADTVEAKALEAAEAAIDQTLPRG